MMDQSEQGHDLVLVFDHEVKSSIVGEQRDTLPRVEVDIVVPLALDLLDLVQDDLLSAVKGAWDSPKLDALDVTH